MEDFIGETPEGDEFEEFDLDGETASEASVASLPPIDEAELDGEILIEEPPEPEKPRKKKKTIDPAALAAHRVWKRNRAERKAAKKAKRKAEAKAKKRRGHGADLEAFLVKTKERLRSKVWWSGIDKEAEKCRECLGCQMVSKHVPPPPIKPTRLPERAWQEIAVELLGPLPTGEHLLVVVDYFSRWMEVDVLRSTTSAAVIKCLDSHFARYGVPAGLRTDNGSNLLSEETEKYLEEMGIVHHCNTPLWPRANGEVERQNRSLLKAMQVSQAEGKDWQLELNKFLLAY